MNKLGDRLQRGEGVPPLHPAGILPAIRRQMVLPGFAHVVSSILIPLCVLLSGAVAQGDQGQDGLGTQGRDALATQDGRQNAFFLPEDPNYTILDSARDSVRFTVERTFVEYKGNLCSKSSFVDKDGNIMGWHDFGNLEGPGWAANAVGGAYELYAFGLYDRNPALQEKALRRMALPSTRRAIPGVYVFCSCSRSCSRGRCMRG
ncbi:MAG TPA: hypothetical protein VLI39_09230 [Sedimentisphaerales bacterium]|nr:hypothetical protein [Sedimentisphaerales bacterium]